MEGKRGGGGIWWRWCEVGVNYHTPDVKQKQMINYTNNIRINYANGVKPGRSRGEEGLPYGSVQLASASWGTSDEVTKWTRKFSNR